MVQVGSILELKLQNNMYTSIYHYKQSTTYIPTPKNILLKKAVINVHNTDNKCFIWSVLAMLHPITYKNHPYRVSHYLDFENELNMNYITYPVVIKDIDKFENQNDISVNVYGVEQGKVYPLRITKKSCEK